MSENWPLWLVLWSRVIYSLKAYMFPKHSYFIDLYLYIFILQFILISLSGTVFGFIYVVLHIYRLKAYVCRSTHILLTFLIHFILQFYSIDVFKASDNYLEEWMENAFSYDALKSWMSKTRSTLSAAYGFSPVWIRSCDFCWENWGNLLSQ